MNWQGTRLAPDNPLSILALEIVLLRTTALANLIENKAEAAYRRGDLYDERRKLMEAWAAYCATSKAGNVVAFRR
jgi:hypothetical protein